MRRTTMIVVGVILCVLGTATLLWQNISYTERETVVDVGPLNVTADTQKSVRLPPILGGVALAAGSGLIIWGALKT